ncbi:MAG: hypothetical protein WD273_07220 [Trueperaceae bacterium]
MRKLIVSLLAVSVLGLGSALAQVVTTDADLDVGDQYWAGVSFGYPFGVNFHFGGEDMLSQGIDLRGNITAGFGGVFGVGADVLVDLPVDTGATPVDVYAGGGLSVAFGEIDNTPGMDTAFGIGLMFGGEYRLVDAGLPEGGVFAEVGPSINLGAGSPFGVNAKLGFNYHF